LVIILDYLGGISEAGLKEFNNIIINNLKSLQSFSLSSYGCFELCQNPSDIIKEACANIQDLKELCLNFSLMKNEDFSAIFSDLKNGPANLERLNLAAPLCSGRLDLSQLNSALNNRLKNLQELKLMLFNEEEDTCVVDQKSFLLFEKALQGLEQLRKLALNMTRIIFERHVDLVPLIPRSSVLESFEIFFSAFSEDLGMSNPAVREFGESVCKFQNRLNMLHISFSDCKEITSETFESICSGINNDMKELNHLTLNFYSSKGISMESKYKMKKLLKDIPIVIFP